MNSKRRKEYRNKALREFEEESKRRLEGATIKELTVAKWVGYITKHNRIGIDYVIPDGQTIREILPPSPNIYKERRQLEVNHNEVIKQVLSNEKELFTGIDDVMETIRSLIQRDVLTYNLKAEMWQIPDDPKNPSKGGRVHYGPDILYLRLAINHF